MVGDGAVDISTQAVGIWGRAAALDAPLADGDRVEIYRPLAMDPKEARRRRAQRRKQRRLRTARYFGQSAAITSLARLVSSARCLSSRILALALLVGLHDAQAALVACAAAPGRGCSCRPWPRRCVPARPSSWPRRRPPPSCAWSRAPGRRPWARARRKRRREPTRPTRPTRSARPRRIGAAPSVADRMSCSGVPAGGGRSLYWICPPLSFHFHCASAGKETSTRTAAAAAMIVRQTLSLTMRIGRGVAKYCRV